MREVRKSSIDVRNPSFGIRKQEDMAKKYLIQILNEFNKNQTEMETLYLTDKAASEMQSNLGYIESFEDFKKLILDALNNRNKSITQGDYTANAGMAHIQVVRNSDGAKLFTPFKRGDVGI